MIAEYLYYLRRTNPVHCHWRATYYASALFRGEAVSHCRSSCICGAVAACGFAIVRFNLVCLRCPKA